MNPINHPTHAPNYHATPPAQRKYTWVVYALYAAAAITGITMLIGVIIAYVKRNEVAGTIDYEHMQYLIRTFWLTLLWSVVGTILAILLVGYVILLLVAVWAAYRVIMGAMRLMDNQPVNPYGWF